MRKAEPGPIILRAVSVALQAHYGQMRRGHADPYILHPLRVAETVAREHAHPDVIVAALLHDVVEDTALTVGDLTTMGMPARTVELVARLTKWWSDSSAPEAVDYKRRYYAAILVDIDAVLIKVADRTDNLLDIVRCLPAEHAWALSYLGKTLSEFGPLEAAVRPLYPAVADDFRRALATLDAALLRTYPPRES